VAYSSTEYGSRRAAHEISLFSEMFSALPHGILRDILKAEDKNSCGNSFAGVQGG